MRLALQPAFGKLKGNGTGEAKELVCGPDQVPRTIPQTPRFNLSFQRKWLGP